MEIIILAAVFAATAGLIIGAYMFVNRRQLAAEELARTRLGRKAVAEATRDILKDTSVSSVPILDRMLRDRGMTAVLADELARAGWTMMPGMFLLTVAGAGMLGVVLGNRRGPLMALALGVIAAAIPWLLLKRAKRKRLAAFELQLPDALDMLANAMRAGYSFQAATKFLSEEVVAPLGPEFGRFYDEQRLGMDVRTALTALQDRVPSLNLKMFVTAVLIQRETGGNLSELLGNLATLMRDRVALKGHIATLTAEPRLSGQFLAVLPVLMFFGLGLLNPSFMDGFRTTAIGHMLLAMAAVSVVIGYVVMMKIADIDV
jgi:tight adherence protein B